MADSQGRDMGRHVDIEEVRDLRNQLLREMGDRFDSVIEAMKDGFEGTHKRQDLTNGRILKLESQHGGLEARTAALERDLRESIHVHRRASDPTPAVAAATADREEKAIRRWDVFLFCSAVGAVVGVIKFLQWIGPALMQAKP